jgi:excisionase family DNA binding protein
MQTIAHTTPPNQGAAAAFAARSLSYKQAAERLGVSVITVRRWVAAKRLRVQRYSTTCVRIPETEVSRLESEALV